MSASDSFRPRLDRRTFLRLAAFGACGCAAGASAAGWFDPVRPSRTAIVAFLPEDTAVANAALTACRRIAGLSATAVVAAFGPPDCVQAFGGSRRTTGGPDALRDAEIVVTVARLPSSVPADAVLVDERGIVDPSAAGTPFVALRRDLGGRRATLLCRFHAGEAHRGSRGSRFVAVVESGGGEWDRIPLDCSPVQLAVAGPIGRTAVVVGDGVARIAVSPCRHRLCEKSGTARTPGDTVVCAPNRVLVRVEWA